MPDYSLSELSALTGLPVRTIRYYVAEGLIPSPGKDGPSTRYPDTTLARLRLTLRLRDAHQPLAAIRARLESLGDDEVIALAGTDTEQPKPGSALDYVRSLLAGKESAVPGGPAQLQDAAPDADLLATPPPYRLSSDSEPPASMPAPRRGTSLGERSHWDRVAITPDIELHVRRPLSRPANRMVDRLVAFARQLKEEEQP
jgi:DNA-binding transcriptional MerR regulator